MPVKQSNRKEVYHGESCKGMVSVTFCVVGKRVEAYFNDGYISSSTVVWSVDRTKQGNYRLTEADDTDTMVGEAKPEIKSRTIKARIERKALAVMIRSIARPYINPGPYDFPVDAEKLRKGLESALLK